MHALAVTLALIQLHEAASAVCEPFCHDVPCSELNGDITVECGACPDDAQCHPGASGFHGSGNRQSPRPQPVALMQAEVAPSGQASTVLTPCRRITARELLKLSLSDRAKLLALPTVISGLLDDWPIAFGGPDDIMRAAKEATSNETNLGPGVVSSCSSVGKFSESPAECAAFLAALEEEFPVPPIFERAANRRVWSIMAEGYGVTFTPNHGWAYNALVAGEKGWFFAPPTRPPPAANPTCDKLASVTSIEELQRLAVPGATHVCAQRISEVVVVPAAWWHATCHKTLTVAIGGEDRCDVTTSSLCRSAYRTAGGEVEGLQLFCDVPERQEACHGPIGRQYPLERDGLPGRLVQEPHCRPDGAWDGPNEMKDLFTVERRTRFLRALARTGTRRRGDQSGEKQDV